jgi:IS4 transposase
LFTKLTEAGVAFVVRLRDDAVIQEEESLPLSAEDVAAGVTHAAWARLGCNKQYRSTRVRLIWVQGEDTSLVLVTNLGPEELSAGDVALLYRERWRVEVFFRWVSAFWAVATGSRSRRAA